MKKKVLSPREIAFNTKGTYELLYPEGYNRFFTHNNKVDCVVETCSLMTSDCSLPYPETADFKIEGSPLF